MSSQGKVAVITGAGHGIGRACALTLSAAGFATVIADIDPDSKSVCDEIAASGGSGYFVHVDMADPSAIVGLFEEINKQFGHIDVLVNNAAVTRQIDFFDVSQGDWDVIMNLSARGYFLAMQAAASSMRETGGGSIVNIASIAGKGWRETSNIAYASSKGAVITMTRIAAARLGEYDIRVNAVCPGMTMTEGHAKWLDGRAKQDGVTRDQLLTEITSKAVPLRRANETYDIANAVLFLSSSSARNITGQSLNVDGGTCWD
jgi:NAD(P)-dependent dehydrogenase (short-subunit alcohol dehydrogenase family)